jgi:hypothetical protein
MFARFVEDRNLGGRYEVATFPLWRGASELHLRRLPNQPPLVTLVTLGEMQPWMRESLARTNSLPFADVVCGPAPDGPVEDLVARLESVGTDLVVVVDGSLVLGVDGWLWEAIKWFELLDDVGAVCGRRVDQRGAITAGGEVRSIDRPSGEQPLYGQAVDAPGPYALGLKPHTIDKVDLRLAVVRRAAVADALRGRPGQRVSSVGWGVAAGLESGGWRTVFDPMLTALAPVGPVDGEETAPRAPAADAHGLGAFVAGRRQYS